MRWPCAQWQPMAGVSSAGVRPIANFRSRRTKERARATALPPRPPASPPRHSPRPLRAPRWVGGIRPRSVRSLTTPGFGPPPPGARRALPREARPPGPALSALPPTQPHQQHPRCRDCSHPGAGWLGGCIGSAPPSRTGANCRRWRCERGLQRARLQFWGPSVLAEPEKPVGVNRSLHPHH